MKKKTLIFLSVVILLVAGLTGAYYWAHTTNPHNYMTLGEIPPPSGFEKVEAENGSFAHFTRKLILKPRGTKVKYYTGGNARLQSLAAAVIDLPLLSNYEQCADAAMRIRAEHFWKTRRLRDIKFHDVGGKVLQYSGGVSRKAFESYLRKVYGVCSTYSLYNFDTVEQNIEDVEPGDLFVFPAKNGKLGHAVLIADVATDKDGRKALLIVEGNTPARDIHVLRNPNAKDNPWFILDPLHPGSSTIEKIFSLAGGNLRRYK